MRRLREQARTALLVLAVALTVAVVALPDLRPRVDGPSAGIVVVTLLGMARLFAALLAAQRFGRTSSLMDAAVGVSLGVLAAVDLAFALDRAALTTDESSSAVVLPYVLLAALLLCAGTCVPDRAVVRRPRTSMVLLWCAAVAVGIFILQHFDVVPGRGVIAGAEPADVVVLRALLVALFALAGVAIALRTRHRRDPLMSWLAASLVLIALAHLYRVSTSATAMSELTWATVLSFAAAGALLVGCVAEVRGQQRRLTATAVADERRRIARDLHDGVAQDVAFIASESKRLSERAHDDRLNVIASAADRALADSRGIVGALTRSNLPLSASIELQAQEFARRWDLQVDVAAKDDVAVDPAKADAVLRIVAEALSNAARHAEATHVYIEVAADDGPLRVAVTDDGRGFDPYAERFDRSGFGLQSMRERAQLVGGEVALMSEPGHGTRIEIAIP